MSPLSFPWESKDRVLVKGRQFSAGTQQASSVSKPNAQRVEEPIQRTDRVVPVLTNPGLPLPDLPEFARRKEDELNRLIHVCYELYNGDKYIDSYGNSEFHDSPGQAPQGTPGAHHSESQAVGQSSQSSFTFLSHNTSSSQVVSPYSLCQQTLDQVLPTTPSNFSAPFERKKALSPTPEDGILTPLSRVPAIPYSPQPSGISRISFLRRASSKNRLASPLYPPSPPTVPQTPNTPDTPEPLRLSGVRLPSISPSTRPFNPTFIWRSSSTKSERKTPVIGLGVQGSERSLLRPQERAPSSSWDLRRSVSSGSRTTASPRKPSISDWKMPMELRKRRARNEPERAEARGAGSAEQVKRRNPYVDEKKLFARNSKLVHRRLHGVFSNPFALDALTSEERQKLGGLLAPSLCLDNDGKPKSYFLKHSVDWRTAIHDFQEDLAAGRYEPEWLEDALAAAASRREGTLDTWKDQHFEKHWGQKTVFVPGEPPIETVDTSLAGLVKQDIFHVGDVWTYSRLFSPYKAPESILVEKKIRINHIYKSGKITFSIPPGQQKSFVHPLPPLPRKPVPSPSPAQRPGSSRSNGPIPEVTSPIKTPEDAKVEIESFMNSINVKIKTSTGEAADNHSLPNMIFPEESDTMSLTRPGFSLEMDLAADATKNHNSMTPKETVQVLTSSLDDLEDHILEIDGRCTSAKGDATGGDPWKLFRCRHDNKDIGTLWDVRNRVAAGSRSGSGSSNRSTFL